MRQGLRLEDIRRLTLPELESYLDIFYPRKNKGGAVVYKSLRHRIHRAEKHTLRQFRYVYFIKTDWKKRLRMKPQPFPKRTP